MPNNNNNNNVPPIFSYILLLGEFLSRMMAENEQKRKDEAKEFRYTADQKQFESNLNKTKRTTTITQGTIAIVGIGAILGIILGGNKQRQNLEARLQTLTKNDQDIRNALSAAQAARQELENSLKNLQDSKQEQATSQTLSPESRLQSSSNVNIDSGMSSSMFSLLNMAKNDSRIDTVETLLNQRMSDSDTRIRDLNKQLTKNSSKISRIMEHLGMASNSNSNNNSSSDSTNNYTNNRSRVTCRPNNVSSSNQRHDREDEDRQDSDNRGSSSTGREQAGPSTANNITVGSVFIPETTYIGYNINILFKEPVSLSVTKLPLLSVVKSISPKPTVLEQQYTVLKDPNCISAYNNSIKGYNDNIEPYNYNSLIRVYRPEDTVLKIKRNNYDTVNNHDEFRVYKVDQNSNSENCEVIAKEAALLNKNYIGNYNKYLNEWLEDNVSKLENINEFNHSSLKTNDISSNYSFVKANLHIKATQLNEVKVIKNPYGFKYNFKSEHPALEVTGLEQEVVFVTLAPTIQLVEFCVLNTNNAFYVGLFVPALGFFNMWLYLV